jgi:hypothetical protein
MFYIKMKLLQGDRTPKKFFIINQLTLVHIHYSFFFFTTSIINICWWHKYILPVSYFTCTFNYLIVSLCLLIYLFSITFLLLFTLWPQPRYTTAWWTAKENLHQIFADFSSISIMFYCYMSSLFYSKNGESIASVTLASISRRNVSIEALHTVKIALFDSQNNFIIFSF